MVLRVKVEIVPFGDEDKARKIRRLDIFNMGHVDFGHCEYGVIDMDPENESYGRIKDTVFHRRDLGALALIKKVLEELLES